MTCYQYPGGPPVRQLVAEPHTTNPTEDPVCEIWHEVWPQWCREFHIHSWIDGNNNGKLDECDYVDVIEVAGYPPVYYHIDRVSCDIIVSPADKPVKAKSKSWGWLKNLFRH